MNASPGRDQSEADRSHGCVAAAGGESDAARQSELVGGLGSDPPGRGRPLDEPRRPGGIGLASQEGVRRPGPRRLVEEPRPGGVAHVGGELAAELEAQIVLRRQDPGGSAAIVRLLPGDPFEFRPGEAGHRLHADDPGQLWMIGGELARLAMGAGVIVQDGGANRLHGAVEEDRPVHLAGEADRLQRAQRPGAGILDVRDRAGHGGRPDVGILLRPAGARTVGRIGALGAGHRRAALVGQQRLEPGGSAVEPEIHGASTAPRRERSQAGGEIVVFPLRERVGEADRAVRALCKAPAALPLIRPFGPPSPEGRREWRAARFSAARLRTGRTTAWVRASPPQGQDRLHPVRGPVPECT